MKRLTVKDVIARKKSDPIVVLTCYTTPMARILDKHVDILLVGDSLGMVVYGFDSTLPVTLEMMIAHSTAVVRGSSKALVVVDLPFGTYQQSKEQAFATAASVMSKTGAGAVKLEGGREMAETIDFLTERGIPVMAHVGLKPQSFNVLGGYKAQGKSEVEAEIIVADAKAVEQAGAFSILVEGVYEDVAKKLTESVTVPTIGIGASSACDGQVLVTEDMLGLSGEYIPRFVKRFANLASSVEDAVKQYAEEVKSLKFPSEEFTYNTKKDSL
jgi:3-methyl-2-oxobutanoate hydroxymethyltransferase